MLLQAGGVCTSGGLLCSNRNCNHHTFRGNDSWMLMLPNIQLQQQWLVDRKSKPCQR